MHELSDGAVRTPGRVGRWRTRHSAIAATVVALGLISLSCARDQTGATSPTTADVRKNVEIDAGPPRAGGQLSIGLPAETNSYNPYIGQWSAASYAVANAVFDPLVAIDPAGNPQPYLARSIASNGDFTEWRIELRPNITFHNGQPLDAAAVKKNLDTARSSGLTSQAFTSIESVETNGDAGVIITMNRPWSTFPFYLSLQAGYMAAPAMLDDPAGANAAPIGTGPFKFVDRQIDAFVRTVKNPGYWQKDASGTTLPYLDSLEFKIVTDASSRLAAMNAGDIGAAQVVTPESLNVVAEAANRGELQVLTDANQEVDETVVAFNTTKEPFNDPIARQALAYAIDQDALAESAFSGAFPGAWGMFEPGSPYYIPKDAAGYPKHDPDKAKQLLAEYERTHGKPLEFTDLVPPDTQYLAIAQTYQAELANYGVKMQIQSVEATQLISRVIVAGDYQAAGFVIWSSPSADQGYIFLASKPNPNGLSLNYPRYDDPEITAAMDDFRATADPKQRVDAMSRVQKRLAQDLQVLFLAHNRSAFAFRDNVHGFGANTFPGGDAPAHAPYPITPFYARVWTSPA